MGELIHRGAKTAQKGSTWGFKEPYFTYGRAVDIVLAVCKHQNVKQQVASDHGSLYRRKGLDSTVNQQNHITSPAVESAGKLGQGTAGHTLTKKVGFQTDTGLQDIQSPEQQSPNIDSLWNGNSVDPSRRASPFTIKTGISSITAPSTLNYGWGFTVRGKGHQILSALIAKSRTLSFWLTIAVIIILIIVAERPDIIIGGI